MKQVDLALSVAQNLLNLPYRWGGNNPLEGFDCSGLIIEILQSVGIFEKNKDTTAHGLSLLYPETDILTPGCLVFWDWNKDKRMDHVEMIAFIDDTGSIFTIGATSGDSKTTNLTNAVMQNAYVKIRPLIEGYCMAVNPFEVA